LALAVMAVATALRFALNRFLDGNVPFITFFPAVLVASVWGGALAGLSALALGSLVAGYLWLTPFWSLDLNAASWAAMIAFWVLGGVLVLVASMLRALVDINIAARERADVMAHEMRHRVGNVLGVVQAIARQTARNAASVEDYQTTFEARIAALGRAQDLVAATDGLPLDLGLFIDNVLEPFDVDRFSPSGPSVALPPDLGSSLALLMHELGTNALKHGALRVPEGRVAIRWAREGGRVRLEWRESGGPPVVAPARIGFGSRLLKTAFPPNAGEAHIAYDATGVRCVIAFRAAR
jgi:two-component sensor histidine kinase